MSQLLIDAEDLIAALENHGYEFEYFLDLETGKVVFTWDEGIEDPDEELELLLENEPERFRAIHAIPSSTGWQVMADFIEQLPDGEASESLVRAVQRSHPFRRFKDELLNYPEIPEEWFAFQYKAMTQAAREWLKDEGIEAELKLRAEGGA